MSDLTDYENKLQALLNADVDAGFQAWPKTPRLNREIVVTEKIDGTNACVVVDHLTGLVFAQSRKKIIKPSQDNFGFARWVFENQDVLREALGGGRHFGEWYGSGIQVGYGLTNGEKRFMLFNAARWTTDSVRIAGLDAIGVEAPTVLYQGPFSGEEIENCVQYLRDHGSQHRPWTAASGALGPAEGVCVFHTASRQVYKVMCENDDIPKGFVVR
jgi:hypothetical protein